MLVKLYGQYEQEFELEVSNLPQLLAGVNHYCGHDVAKELENNQFYYLLSHSGKEEFIPIHPQMVTANFAEFDTITIIPDIAGNGAAIVAAIGGAAFAATTAGIIIAAVINIAISIVIGLLVQLLSPTLSFEGDPAEAQKLDSALFNGAPNIREQGGSVPIIVGTTHAGGVLISAGISSEERIL